MGPNQTEFALQDILSNLNMNQRESFILGPLAAIFDLAGIMTV